MLHLSDLPCVSYSYLFMLMIELAFLLVNGALNLWKKVDAPPK